MLGFVICYVALWDYLFLLRGTYTHLFKGTSNTCKRIEYFEEFKAPLCINHCESFLPREWILLNLILSLDSSGGTIHSSSKDPWLWPLLCSGMLLTFSFFFFPFYMFYSSLFDLGFISFMGISFSFYFEPTHPFLL